MSVDIESFSDELQEIRKQDCTEADELLVKLANENRKPTQAESAYFRSRLNWDETAVAAQVRRMSKVLHFKSIAGTAADRQATLEQAEAARTTLEKESPKLREQIAKAEAKLRQMESDASRATRRSDDQAEAVKMLRQLAPDTVAEDVRLKQAELDFGLGRELSDAEGRERQLRACIDRKLHQSDADHLDCVERSARSAVTRGRDRKVFSPAWPEIKVAMEAEAAELAPKIDELKKQIAQRQAEIDQGLNYYS
jgi:hypothetical protein